MPTRIAGQSRTRTSGGSNGTPGVMHVPTRGQHAARAARFRFRDLRAASAMAVRSLGPPTTMSFVSRSITSCGRAACGRKEIPMSSSMVNVIAIIVRLSGAMSLKPC